MNTISNSQLIFVIVFSVILNVTVLFTLLYALGDRLDKEHPFSIQEKGRRYIFIGVPMIGIAVILCRASAMEHFFNVNVNNNVFPYVFFGAMILCYMAGDILYRVVPKRWVLPLGIAGWVTSFSLLYWYFVFTDPLQHFVR
jgi:hypothetical protein